MQQVCKNCRYFMQHYTLAERKLFRVYCGHCVHIKPRHKRPDTKVCENFAPGEKDTDAFVTEEYLTKALLQRLLSMPLLPDIPDLPVDGQPGT
ncbi:MAG: hypothetical protein E7330_01590 [Clostridiales bacterium]|nr:hypothetical protein [Clostridiales bacterium]